jgi:hypothetical protein
MTADAKHVIEEFEALPDATKQEVLAELLRIADYGDVTDDELRHAADKIFVMMDEEEATE